MPNHPMNPSTTEDRVALARYVETGDPRAFEVLTLRYQAMVLATCRRTLGDLADAEDAAQETFLKLARQAGRIRSNVAAWLHASAVTTSLDLRRTRASRARAERVAAKPADQSAEASADERPWREIEPLLDEALARLDERDRELIVARFLAARPQVDLAREAGVSQGTLSRRLDKALGRLREELQASGLSILSVGALGGALAHGVGATTPALALGAAKVGLVAMNTGPREVALSALIKPAVAAAIVGVGLIGGTLALQSGQGGGASLVAPALAPTALPAPERPKKATRPHPLVWRSNLASAGNVIEFEDAQITMSFPSREEGEPALMRFEIESHDDRKRAQRMQLRLVQADADTDVTIQQMIGGAFDAEYEFDDLGRLLFTTRYESPDGPRTTILAGVRPGPDHPLADRVPTRDSETTLAGPWLEVSDWSLKLDPDNITIEREGQTIHRFRILSWEEAEGYARVQTICADSQAPGMVGDRVKVLVREDEDGYSIAYHELHWGKFNEWPAGFDAPPESGVLVRSFRRARP